MNGYAGKILRLDLTKRKVSIIPTSDYEQWGAGHGMGSAIFFGVQFRRHTVNQPKRRLEASR